MVLELKHTQTALVDVKVTGPVGLVAGQSAVRRNTPRREPICPMGQQPAPRAQL